MVVLLQPKRTMSMLLATLLVLTSTSVAGQYQKKLKLAVERFDDGEMERAIADTRKLLAKYDEPEIWNTVIGMYYHRYRDAVDPSSRLTRQFMKDLTKKGGVHVMYVRDAKQCLQDLLNACWEASYATTCIDANRYLRNYLVDTEPDTTSSPAAKAAMDSAETAFAEGKYQTAIAHYRQVLGHAHGHYKSTLYIGDCHFYLRDLDSAEFYFRKAMDMQPGLMEPRKYLVDALGIAKKYDEALTEAIPTFFIYPDEGMFLKIRDVCERSGKTFDRHWIRRPVTANRVGFAQDDGTGLWKHYREARKELEPYCDSSGVVVSTGAPGGARYLEVWAWERMLQNSTEHSEDLAFARKCMHAGYLDCYVFLCLFHHDLYGQFKAFVPQNKERIASFINDLLIH